MRYISVFFTTFALHYFRSKNVLFILKKCTFRFADYIFNYGFVLLIVLSVRYIILAYDRLGSFSQFFYCFLFLEESAVFVVVVLLCSGGALCMDNQIEVFVRDRGIKK